MMTTSGKLMVQLIVFAAVAGLLFFVSSFYNQPQAENPNSQNLPAKSVELRGQAIHVSVADTPLAREVGLGGRSGLAAGEGMLFVFPHEDTYGFWMKNMGFPIDILWLNSQGEVVYMAENVAPETYPTTFTPSVPALYVLELPAGFVEEHEVVVGDIVRLQTVSPIRSRRNG